MSRWNLLQELLQFYDGKLAHNDEKAFVISHLCFLEEGFVIEEQNQGSKFVTYAKDEGQKFFINYRKEDFKLKTKHSLLGNRYYIEYQNTCGTFKSQFSLSDFINASGNVSHETLPIEKIIRSIRTAGSKLKPAAVSSENAPHEKQQKNN